MKLKLIVLIVFVLLMSGCLDFIGDKVPVVYANFTINEDANGNPWIQQIEVHAGNASKISSHEDEIPEAWPAIYVNIVQNMRKLNYYTGYDYNGPGSYNMQIGMETEANTSAPLVMVAYLSLNDSQTEPVIMVFNWSAEEQRLNKTFK